jgi:hypothetical protein
MFHHLRHLDFNLFLLFQLFYPNWNNIPLPCYQQQELKEEESNKLKNKLSIKCKYKPPKWKVAWPKKEEPKKLKFHPPKKLEQNKAVK